MAPPKGTTKMPAAAAATLKKAAAGTSKKTTGKSQVRGGLPAVRPRQGGLEDLRPLDVRQVPSQDAKVDL